MSGYETFSSVYDILMADADYEGRAKTYDMLIKKYSAIPAKTLLDLACGTGTLTYIFYGMGYDITAVDVSPEMLSYAFQKKLALSADGVLLLCQDMTELDLNDTVDCAVCSLDGINHLTDTNDLEKMMSKVALFLNHGGVFVFDANTVYKHREVLGNNSFIYDCDNVFCAWQNTLYADDIVGINLDIFTRNEYDGKYERQTESFEERAYTHEMLVSAAESAGLDFVVCLDEKTLSEPTLTTERNYYVFKRR